MSTENKSEELNESELDNVAGGAADDGRRQTPDEMEEMERQQEADRASMDDPDDGVRTDDGAR